jgi:hypothetical protein
MFRRDPGGTSSRQWMRHVPGLPLDVGLALMVAVAVMIANGVPPQPGRQPDALAYGLGLTIAGLVLVRRRWPVAVLVASAAALQVYYVLDYAGIRPAVPLSVALATAWAAGHPRWALAVAAWFGGAPLLFRTLIDPEPLRRVLNDTVPDVVLLAAVLVLGEAIRNRRELDREREKSERLLLNVLPSSIAARLKQAEGVIADGFPDVTVLFADIVDFTSRSERIPPEQVVEVLNDLFSVFDQLALQQGWRRSRRSVMPTWWLEACPTHAPTTPRRWPRWPWRCARRWSGALIRAASRWPSASASTPAPSWPASLAPVGSAMTCGATP